MHTTKINLISCIKQKIFLYTFVIHLSCQCAADCGVLYSQVKYKKHKRRDEAKVSKERVARILSSLDNQIRIEPVKPGPSHRSVFNVPNISTSATVIPSNPAGINSDPALMNTEHAYEGSGPQRSWMNNLAQYYTHSGFSGTASPCDKQGVDKGQGHVMYRRDNSSVLNTEYKSGFGLTSDNGRSDLQQQTFSSNYRGRPISNEELQLNSIEEKIYGYNQTGKYYFRGDHAKSEIAVEQSGSTVLQNMVPEQSSLELSRSPLEMPCASPRTETVQRADHHAILRQKLTAPDDDVLTPVSVYPDQNSPQNTLFSYIPSTSHSPTIAAPIPVPTSSHPIEKLLECDSALDLTDLYRMTYQLSKDKKSVTKILCELGDRVVGKFVQWTKRLPFFPDIPIEVHSRLLTSKWHELLLLITTAYKSVQGKSLPDMTSEKLYVFYMKKLQVSFEIFITDLILPINSFTN